MDSISQIVLNGGVAVGVVVAFLWVVIYVVTVVLPKIWDAVREDRKSDQIAYREALQLVVGEHRRANEAMCARLDKMNEEIHRLVGRVDVLDARRNPLTPTAAKEVVTP